MWYRVFSRAGTAVSPAELVEHLHLVGFAVEPHFRGDDLGWTAGELRLAGVAHGETVTFDRFLTEIDDLRGDLNNFAAEIEATGEGPHQAALMQHVIQTQQLVAMRMPADVRLRELGREAVKYLASRSEGIFQIDGEGWFAGTGELLVPEG